MENGFTYAWDEAKRETNLAKHGVDFAAINQADWDDALCVSQVVEGESRMFCLLPIGNRLHAVVYTVRGSQLRIISLRKANKREVRRYEQT